MAQLPEWIKVGPEKRLRNRPTWWHPIQRFFWRRRYGKAPGIIQFTIRVDTQRAEDALAEVDRKLREVGR